MNLSTLGLMKKTGCLIIGFDAVKRELESPTSKIAGVALSNDLSAKTKKEILFLRDKHRPQMNIVVLNADMKQIEGIIGKRTGIAAIMDEGFWKSLSKDSEPIKQ
ncbi:MAG: 50S ribosomal protein L7 [Ruminococcaceae bacterium]|nr:50S ribosomal protein L7 [Oscillospiraceae bacterium]